MHSTDERLSCFGRCLFFFSLIAIPDCALDSLRTFVDLLAVTSGLVAVLHFLVPKPWLDWADRALERGLAWLQARRYESFRQRMADGAYNQRILQIGSALILINGIISCLFKLAMNPISTANVVSFFLIQILVFIFSMAAFYRFGVPLVRWVFAGRPVWLTISKTALALALASGAGLAAFIVGVTNAQRVASSTDVGSMVDAYFVVGVPFGFPFSLLFVLSLFAILVMAVFIANGVVSTILIFYLYCVVFMWAAWSLLATAAFVLSRSLERKGLAVFLASISALFSAIMRFAPH